MEMLRKYLMLHNPKAENLRLINKGLLKQSTEFYRGISDGIAVASPAEMMVEVGKAKLR
jgi:hypothetical protein